MDSGLINDIQTCWTPADPKAGILIQRFDGVWHYSVTLSNTAAIAWGPVQSARPYGLGCLAIHSIEPEFRATTKVSYLDKDTIRQNILASIPAFHHRWNYGIQGWNCEHWARLVATGHPISYQIKEQAFGLFDACGTLHYRGEAIEELHKQAVTN